MHKEVIARVIGEIHRLRCEVPGLIHFGVRGGSLSTLRLDPKRGPETAWCTLEILLHPKKQWQQLPQSANPSHTNTCTTWFIVV